MADESCTMCGRATPRGMTVCDFCRNNSLLELAKPIDDEACMIILNDWEEK